MSRRHAVLQHKDTGELFIYDLGSTHGTFVNKRIIPKHSYVKLVNGDMIRFGQSTRWYIVCGGPETPEEESNLNEDAPKKPLRIVSKKENEEFLFKRRVEQIKRMDE